MQKSEKLFLYLSHTLTTLSGWIFAWMIYFVPPVNPWDVINHPWQKNLQSIHILVVPLLLFSIGWIWKQHVLMKIRSNNKTGWVSGWLLLISLFPMIVSGYCIQISMDAWWRQFYHIIHMVSSGIWTVAFFIHLPLAFRKNSQMTGLSNPF